MNVLYIFLYHILAYVQHNVVVSLGKKISSRFSQLCERA